MNKKFLLAALVGTIVLLLLNAIIYVVFLKDFFQNHPAVSPEFMKQLNRQDDQIIWWAVALSSVAIGFLVTTVLQWSGARTFVSGLKSGFIFAFLFLCAIDFGLFATSNFFSEVSVFIDMICGTVAITIAGAVVAWMLGRGKTT